MPVVQDGQLGRHCLGCIPQAELTRKRLVGSFLAESLHGIQDRGRLSQAIPRLPLLSLNATGFGRWVWNHGSIVLSHWIVVKDEKIKNYQAVVPSTWNASPRDRAGAHGPYEASLLHTPLARPEEPLEVLRTLHSFDPCMACACHAFTPSGQKIGVPKIL